VLLALAPLVRAGLLRSVGGTGGFRLARDPAAVSLLEVIEASDGQLRDEAPRLEPDPDRSPAFGAAAGAAAAVDDREIGDRLRCTKANVSALLRSARRAPGEW
jgi:DNA-binding IscR family transcriptional regulator